MSIKKTTWISIGSLFLLFLLLSFFIKKEKKIYKLPVNKIQNIEYNIGDIIPHDTTLFTQGLAFHNGFLYESTGSPDHIPYAKTIIVKKNLKTKKDTLIISLDKSIFGEGITILNEKIYQLTYLEKKGYVYNLNNHKRINTFNIESNEGWGITNNGEHLILSDGSNILNFIDPESFEYTYKLAIYEDGSPVNNINELEYINGYIYANIWFSNYIVKINPKDGNVIGKLDLTKLCTNITSRYPNSNVLNGIAYDETSKKTYITGKLWPFMYEIEFNY